MGRFFNRSDDTGGGSYGTVQLDGNYATTPESVPEAIRVRPYKEHDGIETAIEFLRDLHDPPEAVSRHGTEDVVHSFEIRYTAGRVNFQFVGHDEWWANNIEASIQRHWPSAQTERARPQLVDMSEGRHLAAAEMALKKYTLYPIKHIGIEGFNSDPFGSIISRMGSVNSDTDATDVTVQVMFQPVDENWTNGVNGGYDASMVAKRLEAPETKRGGKVLPIHKYEAEPSAGAKKAAKLIRDQDGDMGWRLVIRVIATSDSAEMAVDRVDDVAGMFRKYYDSDTKQNFVTEPLSGGDLTTAIDHAVNREWSRSDATIVKSLEETAGLVHVPNSDINQQNVNWTLSRAGFGVPPGTPRFTPDWMDPMTATEEETQAAMFESSEPGEPFWFGFGSRNGIEAGVEEDVLQTHMFVGGESGYGKTTFAGKNLFKQIVDRGYGTLMYDPKGMDAEDIASLVPEEREDDLIYLELGSNRDHQVGFNFLEVPGTAEPGTPEYSAALESMADDLEAILPLASGVHGEGSWGTRMSRISRNIARGLGKLDREVTLYDAHLIASEAAGREAYAQALDEEEVNFIKDYAINHLQEMDDDALEPFSGRLQQLIENDTVREICTLKDGFSIDEAVADGKIIIVQDNDASKTTGKMVATALIRRIWVSIREQTYDPDRPDPDQFYALLDEFKEIATVNSDVAEIFSDARSFGLSMIVMTQDLSSQLSDEIMEAVEGQAETFITFNPGREADARIIASQHSKDMEYDDLLQLPKYRFLMRTHDEDGELTHSYKIDAHPPIDEMEGFSRNDEETEAMIDRQIRTVGSKRRTDEEIMADTAILSAVDDADGGGSDAGGEFNVTDDIEALTAKAIFDESIRRGTYDEYHAENTTEGDIRGGGWVRADHAAERIRRYLPDNDSLSTMQKLWGELIEHVSTERIKREERDDGHYLRCTADGTLLFVRQGSKQNAGGPAHRQLLIDAYAKLTKLGFVVDIPIQSGGSESMGDAHGTLADVGLLQFDDDTTHKEIHDAYAEFETSEEYELLNRLSDGDEVIFEAECSTGETGPAQTIVNYAAVVNGGKRCLFLVREDVAQNVYNTVAEKPRCFRGDYPAAGIYRAYNANKPLRIGGDVMYREAGARETVWLYNERVDEFVLEDSSGEEIARFDSVEEIYSDPTAYPAVEGQIENYDDYAKIKHPVFPQWVFDEGEAPSDDWFDIIVVPNDADEPLTVYDGEEYIPVGDLCEYESESEITMNDLADVDI